MGRSKLIAVISVLLSLVCVILSAYLYRYNARLDEQIKNRDELISGMRQKQDSIYKDTTVFKTSSITFDNKEITTEELIRYANNLHREISELKDSIQYYETYYELSMRTNHAKFDVSVDGGKVRYIYTSKKHVDVDSVNILLDKRTKMANEHIYKYNKLVDEHNKLRENFDRYEKAINKYGIKFQDIDSTSYYIVAPRVDSALILFPYYRKKLKYDANKNMWEIK